MKLPSVDQNGKSLNRRGPHGPTNPNENSRIWESLMADITGGCLCGRVRYTLSGECALSGLCHCRNCQRYTGSAFEPVMVFPSANVSIRGELKTYEDKGDSGKPVLRRFCPNCGSGIMAEAEALPGLAIVLVGGFDDPSVFTPTMESIAVARSLGFMLVVSAS